MNLGYLSPDGKFYSCNSFEHLDLAYKICSKITKLVYNTPIELVNKIEAEKYLEDIGYICFRSRDINYYHFCSKDYKNILNIADNKYLINLLTDTQLNYLNTIEDFDNLEQIDCVNRIIKDNAELKEAIIDDKDIILNNFSLNS